MRRFLFALVAFQAATSVFGDDAPSVAQVSYARDVAPILAQHCLECHGPDAAQREAGLRLDMREASVAKLESGRSAIVPGDTEGSELVRRIQAKGDERMPPPEASDELTDEEVQTLVDWIEQGAIWETHWAFTPPTRPQLPPVQQQAWVKNDIDRFILARLEDAELHPIEPADRRTLIRRVYLDVLGVPPTPSEASEFLGDESPAAWQRCIDRLLASPLYGQRWGRHWLDVARYGDSNGGDENHAYPLAWRYRDYVILALNGDLPFDEFVREQLAGDLMNMESPDNARQGDRVTATGFLALGTKILAERDKVKMRADLVDEQIDTIGKSFLALTLGCARCHDHKFDPIPATDYYALAGILHSTNLGDHEVATEEGQKRKADYDRQLAALNDNVAQLQQQLENATGDVIDRQAEKFDRGNVIIDHDNWGKGVGIISDPGAQENFAEYDVDLKDAGLHLVQLRYAAQNARPGRLLINGKVAREKAISQTTGGWYPKDQRWFSEGLHSLQKGNNVVRVESAPLMSHIDRIRLIRHEKDSDLAQLLKRLDQLEAEVAQLKQNPPSSVLVMAVNDGDVKNVRLHLRGSHLSLGDEVPRGFPGIVAAKVMASDGGSFPITEARSGRLQLARWMTDTEIGSGGQTARVIANRIWHWHFGRGLVGTPNNFGMQGQRPTHPQLLDWLAVELVEGDWSLKSLHRHILLSATYQQSVNPRANRLYQGMPRRRLDAETIRDSLLLHAGRLDLALDGSPLTVKSQDPSPADLKKNEESYRMYRRRSVYLPVVRSNVYRFLTLFDFPNAATPVGRRDTTTVPTQALLLLNDPFVMQQAEQIATRTREDHNTESDSERITALYERLFSRPPTLGEQRLSIEFLREFAATLGAESESIPLAAWTALCHTLIQSSEFVYVE